MASAVSLAVSQLMREMGRRGGLATAKRLHSAGLPANRKLTPEQRSANRLRQQGLVPWLRHQLPWAVACAWVAVRDHQHAPSAQLLIDLAGELGIPIPGPDAAVATLIDRIRCPRCGWRKGYPVTPREKRKRRQKPKA